MNQEDYSDEGVAFISVVLSKYLLRRASNEEDVVAGQAYFEKALEFANKTTPYKLDIMKRNHFIEAKQLYDDSKR